jgi:competence protein ComFC
MPALPPSLRPAARALLDVIFPRWCVNCTGVVPPGALQHVCSTCLDEFNFVKLPHCTTCGWPFHGEVEGTRRCPNCADLEPNFDEGRTGVVLRGPAREFILSLKYRRGWHLRGDLRELVRRMPRLAEFARGAVLVPVPLHPRRRRWRGFNQAQWVAEALAASTTGATVADLLARVRNTPQQTRLNRAARELNMRNAFALRPRAKVSPDTRYIIVDDVFTTGATLNACAATLRHAGATRLDIATFGHG